MLAQLQLFFILSLMKGTFLKHYPMCFLNDLYVNTSEKLSHANNTDLNYFLWNKTSLTAIDYIRNFCGGQCNDSLNIAPQFSEYNIVCPECECRKPACEIYDNCCLELKENNVLNGTSKSPKLGCDTDSNEDFYFLYIRSCPESYRDNKEVKRLCQEDVSINDTTVETFVRVLDSDTQVVYYNTYCAMCNQVQKPVRLTLNTTCTSYMLVYMAEDLNELIRLVLLDFKHCTIYQQFEENIRPFDCYKGQYSQNKMVECERKSSTKMFDPDIIESCVHLTSNSFQVYDIFNRVFYTNIFCAICDLMSYPFRSNFMYCIKDFQQRKKHLYQMLITFGDETVNGDKALYIKTCNDTSWTSPNGQCLQLKCSPGKKLTNGTCTSIFNQITGLGYRVKTMLVFGGWEEFKGHLTDLLDMAEQQLSKYLTNMSDGYSFYLGVVKDNYKNYSANSVPVLWANVFILASKLINRDSFEENAFNLYFKNMLNKTQFYYHLILTEEMYRHCCGESNTSWPVRHKVVENPKLKIPMTLGSKHSIPLSLTLTCSFITFQRFTINFDKSNPGHGVTVTLDLGGARVVISNISDINTLEVTIGNELNVCREVLDKYKDLDTYNNQGYFSLMYMVQIILTYVCMGASELCLLMTLVTYLSLSELRTAPGINNMFLSLSLLLAQLALIVASNMFGPSYLCTFTGIVTHFLWLWQFSWSFLCSFHMFQVFTSKISNHFTRNSNLNIRVIKQLAFSLSLPSVIVSSVIISSYLTSQTSGYGRHSCYLDSTFLIGVSLIGPLCLVSMSNLAFLVVAVSSIHRVNSLLTFDSIKASQFKNFTLYIKLSTVTGVYWIVDMIAEGLDNDVLRLVSIVLNGLQGVSIFLSYTFNKRVYQLLSTKASFNQSTSAPASSRT